MKVEKVNMKIMLNHVESQLPTSLHPLSVPPPRWCRTIPETSSYELTLIPLTIGQRETPSHKGIPSLPLIFHPCGEKCDALGNTSWTPLSKIQISSQPMSRARKSDVQSQKRMPMPANVSERLNGNCATHLWLGTLEPELGPPKPPAKSLELSSKAWLDCKSPSTAGWWTCPHMESQVGHWHQPLDLPDTDGRFHLLLCG